MKAFLLSVFETFLDHFKSNNLFFNIHRINFDNFRQKCGSVFLQHQIFSGNKVLSGSSDEKTPFNQIILGFTSIILFSLGHYL